MLIPTVVGKSGVSAVACLVAIQVNPQNCRITNVPAMLRKLPRGSTIYVTDDWEAHPKYNELRQEMIARNMRTASITKLRGRY